MNRILRRRPSPAMIVASIALFVSLGGVSYAVTQIGTNQIKNGAVTGKKIRNRTIKNFDIARNTINGSRIKESTLGTVPTSNGLARHGVVNSAGAFVHGHGVVSSVRLAPGLYRVVFNRSVGGCSFMASIGDPSTGLPEPGEISAGGDPSNPNAVRVQTFKSNGGAQDKSFHVAVTCG